MAFKPNLFGRGTVFAVAPKHCGLQETALLMTDFLKTQFSTSSMNS